MKNRDGVRQMAKGIYEINFRPHRKSKRVFETIRANSLQEARVKKAQKIAEYIQKNDIPETIQKRQATSLDKLQEVLLNDLRSDDKSKKTINRFIGCWKTFRQFLAEKHPEIDSINNLRTAHFKDYQDYIVIERERTKGWRAELSIIKTIFSRFKKRDYCSKDVIEELKELKRPPKTKKYYSEISDSALRKLLAYIEKDRPDYYGLTVVLFKCGWRIEETTFLRRADIKWDGLNPKSLTIRSETTKTKITREFDMFDDELSAVFRRYAFDRRKSIWLFPNKRNNRINAGHYREYLKSVSRGVIGEKITPHYFRHRLCTTAGRMGLSINDVRAITGIKDIKVLLDYYQHTTSEGKSKVLALSRLR